MLSKGRCGTMLGRCWRLLLLNCAVQGRRCFSKAQVFAWAAPSRYTVLGSQEGSVAVLSFYLWEQDTSSCPPTASAPRIAGSDFIHIFSHPPFPFHLLTAGVKGKETRSSLACGDTEDSPSQGMVSCQTVWEGLRLKKIRLSRCSPSLVPPQHRFAGEQRNIWRGCTRVWSLVQNAG